MSLSVFMKRLQWISLESNCTCEIAVWAQLTWRRMHQRKLALRSAELKRRQDADL